MGSSFYLHPKSIFSLLSQDISNAALDCIEKLLDTDGGRRLTASQCLEHQWLTGSYLDTLKQLETTWMRKYLAKRRWQRWFNTVKAMNRMQRLVAAGETGAGAAIGGSGGSGLPAAADGGAGDAFAGLSLAERAKPNSPPANITGPAKERWV